MKNRCPICEKGTLSKRVVDYEVYGQVIGRYPAEVCSACAEQIFDAKTAAKIERREKELGLFGLSRESHVRRIGHSLGLVIPKSIADFLGLKPDERVVVKPEGKRRLAIELAAG